MTKYDTFTALVEQLKKRDPNLSATLYDGDAYCHVSTVVGYDPVAGMSRLIQAYHEGLSFEHHVTTLSAYRREDGRYDVFVKLGREDK